MRLKQIKLAGFKSFVDPTIVPFPAQMTAIVGPNGCGKSNIIDAVRWVLGESSAKNLRGDAMTDVIFNGASGRKAISQASIELVFDNSLGRLEGEYAKFNEIAVKRSVNRDPVSSYFLNGSKCRKKDITDLFLGTGLGPRSYSIIEQGMISRLIESKPQELRLFIEEAAGISKYKERRRETENRIRHTRENLERLEDVISELQQQLEKLQRQATAAKRYKALKQQERKLKAELNVLRWLRLNGQADLLAKDIHQLELNLDKLLSEQRGDEALLQTLKIEQFQARQQLDDLTQALFKLAQEMSKVEQNLIHLKDKKNQLIIEQNQLASERTRLNETQSTQKAELQIYKQQLTELEPELEICHESLVEVEDNLTQAELVYQQANQNWDLQAKQFYQYDNQIKSQQVQYQSLEQIITQNKQRIAQSNTRLAELNQQQQSINLENISKEKSIAQTCSETIQKQITSAQDQLQVDDAEYRRQTQRNQDLTGEQQKLSAQIASLEILINKQTMLDQSALNSWFAEHGLDCVGELFKQIKVATGWETAVETVLSQWQQAKLVSNKLSLPTKSVPPESLFLVNNQPLVHNTLYQTVVKNSLAAKVQAPDAILAMLSQIKISDEPLTEDDIGFNSVINQAGVWQGVGWQVIPAPTQDNVFVLQQSLAQNEKKMQQVELEMEQNQHLLCQLENRIKQQKIELDHLQQQAQTNERNLYQLQSQYDGLINQQQYQAQQINQLNADIEAQKMAIEIDVEKQLLLAEQIEEGQTNLLELELSNEANENDKQKLQHNLMNLRSSREQIQQEQYQLKLKLEQSRHQISANETALSNTVEKTQMIQFRLEEIATSLIEIEAPLTDLADRLQNTITHKTEIENQKKAATERLNEVETQLLEIEKGQHGIYAAQQKIKDEINDLQIEQEGYRVRAKSVMEVLNELNTTVKQVMEHLPENADEALWKSELEKTTQAITRLGAINLAAIDEYEHQAQRKDYLDAQHQDLNAALDTLEDAIRKIDRETKARFKDTYETVNQDLKQLFPKVFGGGAAWLELTDDDLLDTGVTIMARPPGKRNSTIHLLSGGEKALTALSLVFAIFRLNPAPFCMLDEVDAPLDDANVARFCRLVKEMSSSVQFIFISHNKIAMEMATHLVGVTMQEPGVSRMVAVDIDKAIELAELE